jgi:nucleotide-binding universal stress UspA family protein
MKTIVVLTDFSDIALHAAETSVMLSEKLNTDLFLFNAYINVPVIPQYAAGPWVVDEIMQWKVESDQKLDKLADHLHRIIKHKDQHPHKPSIHYMAGEGNLGENMVDIINDKDVELIVMGARADSNLHSIFNSSDTSSVINHTTRPVLVVPLGADLKQLNKVIFATDFDSEDMKAIHYLVKLGKLFDFELEVVHINLLSEKEIPKTEREMSFIREVTRLKYSKITYKEVKGKDVIDRLHALCNETEADLLAMVHYQHSYFTRLFQHSTTKKALSDQKTPLLIFPSNLED